MSKATKLPGLKNIPANTEPELRGSLQAMKEALAVRLGQEGDPLDRAITLRELVDSGMAKKLTNKKFDPNTTTTDFVGAKDNPVDLSIPPAPTGLSASGAFTTIIIDWNTPAYSGHAFTEVFRSRDDSIGTAQLVTTTEAAITTDEVGYNQEYFYWVRFVNTAGVRGPFNQTNGTKASTVEDIAAVMTQLSQTLANLPGYSVLTNADSTNATNIATVTSNVSTLQTTVNSHASTLTSHTSSINSNTSNVTSLTSTTASHTGDLNAMFVLQASTESNGSKSVAGMVIGSNASDGAGAQSHVQFLADKFAIWNGTNAEVAPFIVSGGSVFIDSARIQNGAITNARIATGTIQTAKIADAAITTAKIGSAQITTAKIGDAQITTAKIGDAQITNAKINDLDAGKINAGTISADRIGANSITASKINVTDLALPTNGGLVSGSSIGNFNNNSKRYAEITTVGTGAGFYQGYVRLVGGTGQVKTIHLLFSDGTVNTTVTSGGSDTAELLDSSSGVVYRTPDIQHLNTSIINSRLISSADTANLPIAFRYTGSGTIKCYIYGQGDGGTRQIGSADVRFVKFSAS
tara:strand:+ start:1645 stop:3378 length:1734 start_codon:yes stop_codon:yes gene_type:complete